MSPAFIKEAKVEHARALSLLKLHQLYLYLQQQAPVVRPLRIFASPSSVKLCAGDRSETRSLAQDISLDAALRESEDGRLICCGRGGAGIGLRGIAARNQGNNAELREEKANARNILKKAKSGEKEQKSTRTH